MKNPMSRLKKLARTHNLELQRDRIGGVWTMTVLAPPHYAFECNDDGTPSLTMYCYDYGVKGDWSASEMVDDIIDRFDGLEPITKICPSYPDAENRPAPNVRYRTGEQRKKGEPLPEAIAKFLRF